MKAMETSLVEKSTFLWTYPEKKVIKKFSGDKILFRCKLAEELDHKGKIETEYDDVIYKEF